MDPDARKRANGAKDFRGNTKRPKVMQLLNEDSFKILETLTPRYRPRVLEEATLPAPAPSSANVPGPGHWALGIGGPSVPRRHADTA